ncbi:MAG: OmpA family protein [Moraxellaceae bacterium]|jgi:outer membrane protein OmpA-like peptidoglycan-associated protein|nr:OmpA family protein [Moraxellaceae bacterium]
MKDMQVAQTTRGVVATLGGVLFDSGKTTLNAGMIRTLDPLVSALKENPMMRITIEGHTDSVGSSKANQAVSAQRAAAVKQYLVDQGADASRIQTEGLGEAYPVASNSTEAGRQKNRRVEVIFTEK